MGVGLRKHGLIIALAGAVLAAGPAMAVPPGVPQLAAPPPPAIGDQPARRFPNGVSMYRGITYATIDGFRPLELDLYLPGTARPGARLPLVLWIHGGGYEIGNPRADWTWPDWSAVLARLAARGYVVAGVSYRLSGEAHWPAQFDDIRAATAFLRAHAQGWGADPQRIYAWGLSAGGHMAALLGTQSASLPPDQQVQGVVDWFGPTDLARLHSDGTQDALARLFACQDGHCPQAALKDASPVAHVSAVTPPMLILHGQADALVPVDQGRALAAQARQVVAPVEMVELPGLGHGFTGASPAQLEAILARTFAYFDRISGRKAAP
jgi:acetyl esterase/lipase